MHLTWPPKLVSENLNYTLNWTDALEGSTVVLSTWVIVTTGSGLILGTSSNSSKITEVWLSSGTPGTVTLRNTITTNINQVFIADVKITIRA